MRPFYFRLGSTMNFLGNGILRYGDKINVHWKNGDRKLDGQLMEAMEITKASQLKCQNKSKRGVLVIWDSEQFTTGMVNKNFKDFIAWCFYWFNIIILFLILIMEHWCVNGKGL